MLLFFKKCETFQLCTFIRFDVMLPNGTCQKAGNIKVVYICLKSYVMKPGKKPMTKMLFRSRKVHKEIVPLTLSIMSDASTSKVAVLPVNV